MNTYEFCNGEPDNRVRSISADAFEVSAVGDFVSVGFYRKVDTTKISHPLTGNEIEANRHEKISEYDVGDGWYVELDRSGVLDEVDNILKGMKQ